MDCCGLALIGALNEKLIKLSWFVAIFIQMAFHVEPEFQSEIGV